MAAEAKANGRNLLDELQEIYAQFGYYKDALDSFTLKGKDGVEKITSMMSQLRTEGTPFDNTKEVIDYSVAVDAEKRIWTVTNFKCIKIYFRRRFLDCSSSFWYRT